MRIGRIFALASLALGTGEQVDPWDPEDNCRDFRGQADHYATALELISNCVQLPTADQKVRCTNKVLSEVEF
jgi:hypothetical protein